MLTRIKEIRLDANMNQKDFANKLGLGQSSWAMIEVGKRDLNERHIKLICSTFDVDEKWLRTGEGTMHRQLTKNDQIAKLFADVLNDDDDSIRRQLVDALAALDKDDWEFLARLAVKLTKKSE